MLFWRWPEMSSSRYRSRRVGGGRLGAVERRLAPASASATLPVGCSSAQEAGEAAAAARHLRGLMRAELMMMRRLASDFTRAADAGRERWPAKHSSR